MVRHRAAFHAVRNAIFAADIETGMVVEATPGAPRHFEELRSLHHTKLHPLESEASAGRSFSEMHERSVTEGTDIHRSQFHSQAISAPGTRAHAVDFLLVLLECRSLD